MTTTSSKIGRFSSTIAARRSRTVGYLRRSDYSCGEHLQRLGLCDVDLQLIKALSWVETGAWIPEWKTRPMQIGNIGDPGLQQILETDSGKLLLPPVYKTTLTKANVVADGNRNIEAGVGYFLWVFAHFGYIAPPPPPPTIAPPAYPNGQSSPAKFIIALTRR